MRFDVHERLARVSGQSVLIRAQIGEQTGTNRKKQQLSPSNPSNHPSFDPPGFNSQGVRSQGFSYCFEAPVGTLALKGLAASTQF